MRGRESGEERREAVTIAVYSRAGCGVCEAAKAKLDLMGFRYENHDLMPMLDLHEGWREDGSIEVLAGYASLNNSLPVIRIGGDFHDYPSAMRQLKAMGLDVEIVEIIEKKAHGDEALGKAAAAGRSEPTVH